MDSPENKRILEQAVQNFYSRYKCSGFNYILDTLWKGLILLNSQSNWERWKKEKENNSKVDGLIYVCVCNGCSVTSTLSGHKFDGI